MGRNAHLVVEVFRPPLGHQVVLDLPVESVRGLKREEFSCGRGEAHLANFMTTLRQSHKDDSLSMYAGALLLMLLDVKVMFFRQMPCRRQY